MKCEVCIVYDKVIESYNVYDKVIESNDTLMTCIFFNNVKEFSFFNGFMTVS